jgi:hypothetical protein
MVIADRNSGDLRHYPGAFVGVRLLVKQESPGEGRKPHHYQDDGK